MKVIILALLGLIASVIGYKVTRRTEYVTKPLQGASTRPLPKVLGQVETHANDGSDYRRWTGGRS